MALAAALLCLVVVGGLSWWWAQEDDAATTQADDTAQFAAVIDEVDPESDNQAADEDRILTVLIPYDRTRFFLIGGEPKGFEYDLVQEFAKSYNADRAQGEPALKTVYLPTPFSQLIPLLEQGIGDMAAGGLTITQERAARVDFTDPYITNVREILVIQGTDAAPASFDELADTEIYLAAGSSYVEHANELNENREADGLSPLVVREADPSLMSEDLLEMVNAGIIEATIVDHHIAELWQGVLPNIQLTELALSDDNAIAWALPKAAASASLKQDLNAFINQTRQGTLIGNILFERYYENQQWIKNPITEEGLEQLSNYRPLFERYGEEFGFDWRFLAALVFQESGFDPKAKSHRGARGLMQLMPETAAEVGVKNLDDPADNIRGGAAYLAFLREHFVNDPEIPEHERERLILAAYNAGPGRLRELRETAESMGRDPNRWFNHVERAAQRIIGDETVRYVANINKYRIAYSLSEAVLAERQSATQ